MYPISRNACKLFVESSKRHYFIQSSVYGLFYSTTWRNHKKFHNPVEDFVENEDVISWTSKISRLVRRNKSHEAIELFRTMLINEQKLNYVTILSLIRAAGDLNSEDVTQEIHSFVIKLGLESEVSVMTALVNVYSVWDMEFVVKIYRETPNKGVVLWTALVSACVKGGMYVEAFNALREMQFYGVKPNHLTISSILPVCADVGALWFGKQIHGFFLKTTFYSNTYIQNSLLHMYAKCRNLEDSAQVFVGMPKKVLISWRTMIYGCMENGRPGKALNLFINMLSCSCMPDEGIIRKAVTASLDAGERNFGVGLHSLIQKSGYLSFVFIVNALLDMYTKFGKVEYAITLFDQLHRKDLFTYNVMMSAYAQNELPSDAFITFKDMQFANEKPNERTFVSLLQASSTMTAKGIGESIHARIYKAGCSSIAVVRSALIVLYCKFGCTRQAKAVFDEMPTNNLIGWSSMINGYGINGYGNEALETFSEMLKSGIMPNDVVFTSVLSACSHCGLEDEGWNWFYAMQDKFGIAPQLPHYACMVDMLSRRGYVEEALDFVNKLPVKPDIRIWVALLAGCRKNYGSTEVAEIAAHQLISLEPENSSYYVFLSNLYAQQNRWEDVDRLRNSMEEKRVKKGAAYSIVATNL